MLQKKLVYKKYNSEDIKEMLANTSAVLVTSMIATNEPDQTESIANMSSYIYIRAYLCVTPVYILIFLLFRFIKTHSHISVAKKDTTHTVCHL